MRIAIPLTTFLILTASPACAQDEPKLTTVYFGVKACDTCHGKESDSFENRQKFAKSEAVFTSRLLESRIWAMHDKHKDAARVLSNARSRRIAEIMKLPSDLTNEPRCAKCHGVWIDPAQEKFVHADTFQGEDRLASGVSCVSCHGAVREWVNEHAAPLPEKKWSSRSREEKTRHFGLRDLWDPVERAKLCFSCHIGNLEEGKFVTHEMYAAGHPPLPSVELAAFAAAMPRHWETLTQKAARARSLGDDAKNGPKFLKTAYGIDPEAIELEETRLVAISSLAALRDSVRMMGQYAAESISDADRRPWPELAFYDCYACHHDLKTKSWRLERGFAGRPGRPTVRPWPYPLALVVDRLLPPPSKLKPALAHWQTTFQDVPFGDPRQVAERAKVVDHLLTDRIVDASKTTFDRPLAERLARNLADAAVDEIHDFDSARQFAWALRTIAAELRDEGRYVLRNPGDPRFHGPLFEPFASLEKSLYLKLPEGQVEIAPASLDAVFTQISAYDPTEFRTLMRRIRAELGK